MTSMGTLISPLSFLKTSSYLPVSPRFDLSLQAEVTSRYRTEGRGNVHIQLAFASLHRRLAGRLAARLNRFSVLQPDHGRCRMRFERNLQVERSTGFDRHRFGESRNIDARWFVTYAIDDQCIDLSNRRRDVHSFTESLQLSFKSPH